MVLGFKAAGVHVLFYNLRKPVIRCLRATCARQDVSLCRSDLEVYALIDAAYGDSHPAPVAAATRTWMSRSYAQC